MLCQATGKNMFDGRGNERGSVHRLRQRFWLRLLVWCLFLMEFSRAILGGGGGGGGGGRLHLLSIIPTILCVYLLRLPPLTCWDPSTR